MIYYIINIVGERMKRIKYLLLFVLMLFTFNVKAVVDHCEKEELARLKELAKKVEFDYDYKLVNEKAVFSISAINLNEDLKVVIIDDYFSLNYKEFKNDGTGKGTLDSFNSGEKVVVTIQGYVPNFCSGKTLLTKTIKLPYYNYYYDAERCNGNEDFKYCKQLISSNITKESFENEFALYLKSKETKEEEEEKKKDNTLIYIIIGGVCGVLAIGATTMIIINTKKKNAL